MFMNILLSYSGGLSVALTYYRLSDLKEDLVTNGGTRTECSCVAVPSVGWAKESLEAQARDLAAFSLRGIKRSLREAETWRLP